MTRTYTETVTLEQLICDACGITFAVPHTWLEGKQRTSSAFFCPNGHNLSYAKSTVDLLREQLQSEHERRRQVELQLTSANDQLTATKRELQQHKKRVANGVCPCCNRSFVQLQRHMKTKHPEYSAQ